MDMDFNPTALSESTIDLVYNSEIRTESNANPETDPKISQTVITIDSGAI